MWLGREKGACSTWWPHGQKVPRSSNANYLRTMEWVTAVLTFPLLSRPRGNITDWARWALWILWYIFNPSWFEPPQLSLPTILWVCGFIFNKLCKSEPFYVKAFSSSRSMQIVTLSPSLWVLTWTRYCFAYIVHGKEAPLQSLPRNPVRIRAEVPAFWRFLCPSLFPLPSQGVCL